MKLLLVPLPQGNVLYADGSYNFIDRPKSGEILNVNNHNIFSKTVGNEKASILARTPEEYSIPKPVYIVGIT